MKKVVATTDSVVGAVWFLFKRFSACPFVAVVLMFGSEDLLLKKGEYAMLWRVSHISDARTLKKSHVSEINVKDQAISLEKQGQGFHLRLASFLLFGIARIHDMKTSFLKQDAILSASNIEKGKATASVNLPTNQPVAVNAVSSNDLSLFVPVVGDLDEMLAAEQYAQAFEFAPERHVKEIIPPFTPGGYSSAGDYSLGENVPTPEVRREGEDMNQFSLGLDDSNMQAPNINDTDNDFPGGGDFDEPEHELRPSLGSLGSPAPVLAVMPVKTRKAAAAPKAVFNKNTTIHPDVYSKAWLKDVSDIVHSEQPATHSRRQEIASSLTYESSFSVPTLFGMSDKLRSLFAVSAASASRRVVDPVFQSAEPLEAAEFDAAGDDYQQGNDEPSFQAEPEFSFNTPAAPAQASEALDLSPVAASSPLSADDNPYPTVGDALSKRSLSVLSVFESFSSGSKPVSFLAASKGESKSRAAQLFFEVLVLHSAGKVKARQAGKDIVMEVNLSSGQKRASFGSDSGSRKRTVKP
jgi:hypothetical protein